MLIPSSLISNATQSVALLAPSPGTLISEAAQHCNTLGHCRTIWNIIWSCLATIFACIWVAVHPNIPQPKPPRKTVSSLGWLGDVCTPLGEKVIVALVALLAPEFIFAWAVRQWIVARSIAADCRKAAAERDTKRATAAILRAHSQVEVPLPDAESLDRGRVEMEALENIPDKARTRYQNGRLGHLRRRILRHRRSLDGKSGIVNDLVIPY